MHAKDPGAERSGWRVLLARSLGVLWLASCLATSCSDANDASRELALPQGPPIRIILGDLPGEKAAGPLYVRGPGGLRVYSIAGPATDPVLLRELDDGPVEIVARGDDLLVAGEEFGSRVRLVARSEPWFEIALNTAGVSASGVEGSSPKPRYSAFRGLVDIFYYGDALRVINELSLEEYLAGVLAGEMRGDAFSIETLKAQAIAARTYTLYNLKRTLDLYGELPPDVGFERNVDFQSYEGMDAETARIREAVRQTAGFVLLYENRLFQTYYHSNCGGGTASGTLFGEQDIEPLAGVACSYCRGAPGFQWKARLPREDLARALKAWSQAQGVEMGDLVRLDSVPTQADGRSPYVKVIHSGGAFEIRTDQFRALVRRSLGQRVPSPRFSVAWPEGDGAVVLSGHGNGHGVGFCQYGATELGKTRAAGEILAHYFPMAGQKKVY